MTSSDGSLRDCVEVRIVPFRARVRLFAPTLAKVSAILVAGSAALLLRASLRGRLSATAVILAVIFLTLPPLLLWHARRKLVAQRMIATFRLSKAERGHLAIPKADSPVSRRETGRFLLGCRDGRPRLMEGLTIHDAKDVGIAVTVLVSRRDSVVGIELRRAQHAVRTYAFGP